MISRWLIRRRDAAADAWIRSTRTGTHQRHARRRLAYWDFILDTWTNRGRR